ncbi:MAG: adenylate kinase [Actinomycetota bacterium]|nr:adenylate kinase [Actinomycetota bacterium]
MRLLMLAAPGAGKGTQGARIAEHFQITHIATGDRLRDEVERETPLGLEVKEQTEKGELVPDEVIIEMLRDPLVTATRAGGYVLDGFPRTLAQAQEGRRVAKELGVQAQAALYLTVDDDELVRRLLARAETEGRSDDNEETIKHRLELFHEVTQPVVQYYDRRGMVITVDAMRSIDEVAEEILAKLEVLKPHLDTIETSDRTPADVVDVTAPAAAGAERG